MLERLEDFTGDYIDDVIVGLGPWEEHLRHLRQVLERLRTHGLTAKESKCEWGASSLTYLGQVVGEGKVSVPEARVVAIRNFRKPHTKSDLRSFLGTVGYYRKFNRDYSMIAHTLTEATKKSAPNVLHWSNVMYDAFVLMCNCLSVLTLPKVSDQFVLYTDASGLGIGAVLSVERDGEEIPVGYFSKKLSPLEQKYSVTELECLAVVKAIDHFTVYLWGRSFTVVD